MPLTSLPMELHREIIRCLDLASLFCFSKTNRYFRTLYMSLPPKDVQETVHYFLDSDPRKQSNHDPWGSDEKWDVLYSIEEDFPHLLKRFDLLPCYACYAVYPSTDFGDWTAKRLTEIDDDGMPLQGVCHNEPTDYFHLIFRALVAKEAAGEEMRTKYPVSNDCQSYLYAARFIEDKEHNDAEIQALVRYMKSHESYSGQRNEQ